MAKKILIILTSADKIPALDIPTGWYLPELAHPYKVLEDAGMSVDIVSPKGGEAPMDPGSADAFKDDPVCQWFMKNATAQALIKNTKTLSQINAKDYRAVFYPGGHGPMFDLASDVGIAALTAQVYEAGGVVAAVCHGPAALVPIKLSNGDALVKGKRVTAFSNAEEEAVKLTSAMPFSLEDKLVELGAKFEKKDLWQEYVVRDGRLITGQNPASSTALALEFVKVTKEITA